MESMLICLCEVFFVLVSVPPNQSSHRDKVDSETADKG